MQVSKLNETAMSTHHHEYGEFSYCNKADLRLPLVPLNELGQHSVISGRMAVPLEE